ncbi:hypothetical protein TH62_21025 [Bacillus sp. TH008]|nr:hypothetical protein TH62_21025 [Bacillus sp. TH008]
MIYLILWIVIFAARYSGWRLLNNRSRNGKRKMTNEGKGCQRNSHIFSMMWTKKPSAGINISPSLRDS